MRNGTILAVGLVLAAIVAVGGAWLYNVVLGETEAPSGPITAVPVLTGTRLATATSAPASTGAPAAATAASTAAASPAPSQDVIVFEISQAESEVRFSLYEELGGQPTTVVGVSDQVYGQVAVNISDLSQTQVGVIQINARTLATDRSRRNQAIRNLILQTDRHEFITFTPNAVIGLSGPARAGQALAFQIAGDLTIRDITRPVVFEVTAQADSITRLSGTATAVIQRGDYNLVIPSVPNVANVGEEVTLVIDFVAVALN